jgi:predicted dehydrogenase
MYNRIWILAAALFCLASVLQAESVPVVKDADAAKFVGKNVEVRGQVVSVYIGKHGDAYVFFGARYPKQTFTGYIPAGWTFSGGPRTLKLQGEIIGVTGTVEMYEGKPEIKILSQDQIKQTDSRSKAK